MGAEDDIVVTPRSIEDTEIGSSASHGAAIQRKHSLKARILSKIWDTFDKSPEERRVVTKLDWFILTYVCLAYFVKYLDQTNVNNAYVSGMKEDLQMQGNQFNILITCWTIGYILGQIPSQIMLTKVRPSIWLPGLELTWSILVIGMAGAKNVETMYALRFLVGLLEASAYPGIMTLLGNWYLPSELGKRSCIFQASSSVAQMFGGYLQAALYANMNGTSGLAAWRWLFIFDGIIGVPIALYGFFAVPDSPTTSRARWLKPDEKDLAICRVEEMGRRPSKSITMRDVVNLFKEWPVYLFPCSFMCYISAIRVYTYFPLYLKETGLFTVEEVNIIPTGAFGSLVVFTLLVAWFSDGFKNRWCFILLGAVLSLTGAIILEVSVRPGGDTSRIIGGFYLTYLVTGTAGIYMSYINEVCSYNYVHRALIIAISDTLGFTFVAWLPLVVFNTGEAPWFKIGYKTSVALFCFQIFFLLMIPIAQRYLPVGKYEKQQEEMTEES